MLIFWDLQHQNCSNTRQKFQNIFFFFIQYLLLFMEILLWKVKGILRKNISFSQCIIT